METVSFEYHVKFNEWAKNKTWEEIYNTCHDPRWLLWLFSQTNKGDNRLLSYAKAQMLYNHRYLLGDNANHLFDIAIQFGKGEIDYDEQKFSIAIENQFAMEEEMGQVERSNAAMVNALDKLNKYLSDAKDEIVSNSVKAAFSNDQSAVEMLAGFDFSFRTSHSKTTGFEAAFRSDVMSAGHGAVFHIKMAMKKLCEKFPNEDGILDIITDGYNDWHNQALNMFMIFISSLENFEQLRNVSYEQAKAILTGQLTAFDIVTKDRKQALANYADIVRQCIPFEKFNFPSQNVA